MRYRPLGEAESMFDVSLTFCFLSQHSSFFQSEAASVSRFPCIQVGENRKMDACAEFSPVWDKRGSGTKRLTMFNDSSRVRGKLEILLKDTVIEMGCRSRFCLQ